MECHVSATRRPPFFIPAFFTAYLALRVRHGAVPGGAGAGNAAARPDPHRECAADDASATREPHSPRLRAGDTRSLARPTYLAASSCMQVLTTAPAPLPQVTHAASPARRTAYARAQLEHLVIAAKEGGGASEAGLIAHKRAMAEWLQLSALKEKRRTPWPTTHLVLRAQNVGLMGSDCL